MFLPLHLILSAGWLSYNWVILSTDLTDFTGFVAHKRKNSRLQRQKYTFTQWSRYLSFTFQSK